jgi:hypothetical protein
MSLKDSDVPDTGWRKASWSIANGQCVEVACAPAAIVVRDSVNPSGPVVSYPASVWRSFLVSTKTGTFGINR